MNKKIYSGAIILGLANVIVKILGLFFIFPFAKMVGNNGTSLYTYAYIPFVFFMDISTLGLIPGVSKLVSAYKANNEEAKAKYLLVKSRIIMLIIGLAAFIFLNAFAKRYAYIVLGGNLELENSLDNVTMAIRCVSPSLLIGPIIALYRGFLQGNLTMIPSALSIIIEQLIRLVVILGGSYLIIHVYQKDYRLAVYLAVMAASIALFVSFIFLFLYSRRYLKCEKEKDFILKKLIKTCIPFGLTTIFMSINQSIDSLTFNKGLQAFGEANVETFYSVYLFEVSRLIIIPIILAQALASSLMPNITANKNIEENKKAIYKSLNIVISLAVGVCLLTRYFSKEVYELFYNNASVGPAILKASAVLIVTFSLNKIIIAIMQGVNLISYLAVATVLACGLKFFLNPILIKAYSYNGAVLATVIATLFIIGVSLALLKIKKVIKVSKILSYLGYALLFSTISLVIIICFRAIYPIEMLDFKSRLIGLSAYSLIFISTYFLFLRLVKLKNN